MSMLSLICQMRARLFAALALFLTEPVKRYSPATTPILPIHTPRAAVSAADHRYVIPGDFETAAVLEIVGPRTDSRAKEKS